MVGGCVVCVLVAVVAWSLTPTDSYLMWCSPKLWEGRSWTLQIKHTDQGTEFLENTAEISVDIIGQRYARQETGKQNGQSYSVFYLYYYPASTLYVVRDGNCETRPLSGNISQHCVEMPDSHALEYLKEYMGDYNEGVWCGGVRTLRQQVEYFYSVENDLPLIEEKHGEIDDVPTYTVTNYYNITLGIRDATIFTPPDNCIKSQK